MTSIFLIICITNFMGYSSSHLIAFNPVISNKASDFRVSLGQILNIPEVKQRSFDLFKSRGEFISLAEKYIANRNPFIYKKYKPYKVTAKPTHYARDYVNRILNSIKWFNVNPANNNGTRGENYNTTSTVEPAITEQPLRTDIVTGAGGTILPSVTTDTYLFDFDTTSDAYTTTESSKTSKSSDLISTSTESIFPTTVIYTSTTGFGLPENNAEYVAVSAPDQTTVSKSFETSITDITDTPVIVISEYKDEYSTTNDYSNSVTSSNQDETTMSELYQTSSVTEVTTTSPIPEVTTEFEVTDDTVMGINTEPSTVSTSDQTERLLTSTAAVDLYTSLIPLIATAPETFEDNTPLLTTERNTESSIVSTQYQTESFLTSTDADVIYSNPISEVTTGFEVIDDTKDYFSMELNTASSTILNFNDFLEETTVSEAVEGIMDFYPMELVTIPTPNSTELLLRSTDGEFINSSPGPEETSVSETIEGITNYSLAEAKTESSTVSISIPTESVFEFTEGVNDYSATKANTDDEVRNSSPAPEETNVSETIEVVTKYSLIETKTKSSTVSISIPTESFPTPIDAEDIDFSPAPEETTASEKIEGINDYSRMEANTESNTISISIPTELFPTSTDAEVIDSSPAHEETTVSKTIEGSNDYSRVEASNTESSTASISIPTESFSTIIDAEVLNSNPTPEETTSSANFEFNNDYSRMGANTESSTVSISTFTESFITSTDTEALNPSTAPEETTVSAAIESINDYSRMETNKQSSTASVSISIESFLTDVDAEVINSSPATEETTISESNTVSISIPTELFPISADAEVINFNPVPEETTVSKTIEGNNDYSRVKANTESSTVTISNPTESFSTIIDAEDIDFSPAPEETTASEKIEGINDYSRMGANTESNTVSISIPTELFPTSTDAEVIDSSPAHEETTVSKTIEGSNDYSRVEASNTESSTASISIPTESFSTIIDAEVLNSNPTPEETTSSANFEFNNDYSRMGANTESSTVSISTFTESFITSTDTEALNPSTAPEETTVSAAIESINDYSRMETNKQSSTASVSISIESFLTDVDAEVINSSPATEETTISESNTVSISIPTELFPTSADADVINSNPVPEETTVSKTIKGNNDYSRIEANTESSTVSISIPTELFPISADAEVINFNPVPEETTVSKTIEGNNDYSRVKANTESSTVTISNPTESFSTIIDAEDIDFSPAPEETTASEKIEGINDYSRMGANTESNTVSISIPTELFPTSTDAEVIDSSPSHEETTVSKTIEGSNDYSRVEASNTESSTASISIPTESFSTIIDAEVLNSNPTPEETTSSANFEFNNDYSRMGANTESSTVSISTFTESFITSTDTEALNPSTAPEETTVSAAIESIHDYSRMETNKQSSTASVSISIESFLTDVDAEVINSSPATEETTISESNTVSISIPTELFPTSADADVINSNPVPEETTVSKTIEGNNDNSRIEANTESSTVSISIPTELFPTSTYTEVINSSPAPEETTVSATIETINDYSRMEAYTESSTVSVFISIGSLLTDVDADVLNSGPTPEETTVSETIGGINDYSLMGVNTESSKISNFIPIKSFLTDVDAEVIHSSPVKEATIIFDADGDITDYLPLELNTKSSTNSNTDPTESSPIPETTIVVEPSTILTPELITVSEPFEIFAESLVDSASNYSSPTPELGQEETTTEISSITTTEINYENEIQDATITQISSDLSVSSPMASASFGQPETTTAHSTEIEEYLATEDIFETSTMESDQLETTTGFANSLDSSMIDDVITEEPTEFSSESQYSTQFVMEASTSQILSEVSTTEMDMQESFIKFVEDQKTTEFPDVEKNTTPYELGTKKYGMQSSVELITESLMSSMPTGDYLNEQTAEELEESKNNKISGTIVPSKSFDLSRSTTELGDISVTEKQDDLLNVLESFTTSSINDVDESTPNAQETLSSEESNIVDNSELRRLSQVSNELSSKKSNTSTVVQSEQSDDPFGTTNSFEPATAEVHEIGKIMKSIEKNSLFSNSLGQKSSRSLLNERSKPVGHSIHRSPKKIKYSTDVMPSLDDLF